jgi:hypothetical protein
MQLLNVIVGVQRVIVGMLGTTILATPTIWSARRCMTVTGAERRGPGWALPYLTCSVYLL